MTTALIADPRAARVCDIAEDRFTALLGSSRGRLTSDRQRWARIELNVDVYDIFKLRRHVARMVGREEIRFPADISEEALADVVLAAALGRDVPGTDLPQRDLASSTIISDGIGDEPTHVSVVATVRIHDIDAFAEQAERSRKRRFGTMDQGSCGAVSPASAVYSEFIDMGPANDHEFTGFRVSRTSTNVVLYLDGDRRDPDSERVWGQHSPADPATPAE